MSLRFAEVEAQREELVMVVRNLRSTRRWQREGEDSHWQIYHQRLMDQSMGSWPLLYTLAAKSPILHIEQLSSFTCPCHWPIAHSTYE
jgi:hypothetical protein